MAQANSMISQDNSSLLSTSQQLESFLQALEGNHILEIKGEYYLSLVKEVHASVLQLDKLQKLLIKAGEAAPQLKATPNSPTIRIRSKRAPSTSRHTTSDQLFTKIKITKKNIV